MRHNLLKIAAKLPKGDETRRKLLAVLRRQANAKDIAHEWAEMLKDAPLEVRREAGDFNELQELWQQEHTWSTRNDLTTARAYTRAVDGADDPWDDMMGIEDEAFGILERQGIVGRRAR